MIARKTDWDCEYAVYRECVMAIGSTHRNLPFTERMILNGTSESEINYVRIDAQMSGCWCEAAQTHTYIHTCILQAIE